MIIAILFSVQAAAKTSDFNRQTNRSSGVGINTHTFNESHPALPFVDLFRLSLPFEDARPWLTTGNVNYDAQGWPKNLGRGKAGTRFLQKIPARALPIGLYTVLYDGKGELKYGGDIKLTERDEGIDLITFPAKAKHISATLSIIKSDPRDPLRNIRILMPGGICTNNPMRRVEQAKDCKKHPYLSFADHHRYIIFNPDYLKGLKNFKVLRFAPMSGARFQNLTDWDKRLPVDQASWGGLKRQEGLPLEIMIELANQLQINPWFNVPYKADAALVEKLAEFLHQRLKPGLTVYLSYGTDSGDNIAAAQRSYWQRSGMQQGLGISPALAGQRFYIQRSLSIFQQWSKLFAKKRPLVRVIRGNSQNTDVNKTLLSFADAHKHIDALAIAPYFQISAPLAGKIKSINDVFRLLLSSTNPQSVPRVLQGIRRQARLAKSYNLQLIAYQGGKSINPHGLSKELAPVLKAANHDSRMIREHLRLLKGWKSVGGKLFVSSALQTPIAGNRKPPYTQALTTFNRSERCWWRGCQK